MSCQKCGGAQACTCQVIDADGNMLPGDGSAAAPYALQPVATVDTATVGWDHARTGTAANPLQASAILDPAGVAVETLDGIFVPSICDQANDLPVDVPALTDRVVLTGGTDCKTALISDLPFPPPDPCVIIQDYFTPPPAAVPALTPAAVMAVISDGAGGWLCRFVQNTISVATPIFGGSGSPPPGYGSTSVALSPGGPGFTFNGGPGVDVASNTGFPGVVNFSVRDSNVAWSFTGTPASGGSLIYIDPATRRLFGPPPHLQADTTTHTVSAVVGALALAANVKTFTGAAHSVTINNPSATRSMRVQFLAQSGGTAMSRNVGGNLNWNLDWMVNAAIIDFGFMNALLAAQPVATINTDQFAAYSVGNFTIAPGGSATFAVRPWMLGSVAMTANRLGTGYRYGVSVRGWTL